MASNNADCVFDEVLLISSARNKLHIIAPSLNSKSEVFLLYIVNPVTSDGSTSGVNCILLYFKDIALESASASDVFPTPGISSISTCPSAIKAVITSTITSSLPTITFLTSSIILCTASFPVIF